VVKRLLVVNKRDKIIGSETLENCHKGKGILHRAFSILVFNRKNQVLLAKRSKSKKLWPLFWDNTCSSHPLRGQSYIRAGKNRLKEEFGFTCQLKLIDKFQYQARYRNIGSENELCALLIGKCNPKRIKPNPKEISDWKWADFKKIRKAIKKNHNRYTPWLKIDLRKLKYKAI